MKILCSFCMILLVACNEKYSAGQQSDLKLWYQQPAGAWEEALPLGNGRLGAMVFGGVYQEHYSLNDHSLWSGAPVPGNIENGVEILSQVREAVFNENYERAGEIGKKCTVRILRAIFLWETLIWILK